MLLFQVASELGLGCIALGVAVYAHLPKAGVPSQAGSWGRILGALGITSFATAWGLARGWSGELAQSVLIVRGLGIPALIMSRVSRDLAGSDWRFGLTARRLGMVAIGATVIAAVRDTHVEGAVTLVSGNPSLSPASPGGAVLLTLMAVAWAYVVAGCFLMAHQVYGLTEFRRQRRRMLFVAWAFLLSGILGGAAVVLQELGEITLMKSGLLVAHTLNVVPLSVVLVLAIRAPRPLASR